MSKPIVSAVAAAFAASSAARSVQWPVPSSQRTPEAVLPPSPVLVTVKKNPRARDSAERPARDAGETPGSDRASPAEVQMSETTATVSQRAALRLLPVAPAARTLIVTLTWLDTSEVAGRPYPGSRAPSKRAPDRPMTGPRAPKSGRP